jgi:hypothetical protein
MYPTPQNTPGGLWKALEPLRFPVDVAYCIPVGHLLKGFRSKSKVVSYGKLTYMATRCRASFHTRRLGLMDWPNAADRFLWPLEGLGTATISPKLCQLLSFLSNATIAMNNKKGLWTATPLALSGDRQICDSIKPFSR